MKTNKTSPVDSHSTPALDAINCIYWFVSAMQVGEAFGEHPMPLPTISWTIQAVTLVHFFPSTRCLWHFISLITKFTTLHFIDNLVS